MDYAKQFCQLLLEIFHHNWISRVNWHGKYVDFLSLVECTCVSCFDMPDMKGIVSVWEDETATNVLSIFLILQLNGMKSEGVANGVEECSSRHIVEGISPGLADI